MPLTQYDVMLVRQLITSRTAVDYKNSELSGILSLCAKRCLQICKPALLAMRIADAECCLQ